MAELSAKAFLIIRDIFFATVLTTLIGLILPGYVAYRQKVFTYQGMADRVNLIMPEQPRESLKQDEKIKREAERRLEHINWQLVSTSPMTAEQVSALASQRIAVERLMLIPPQMF